MKVMQASRRPPYPFFLGGAARCAHRLLLSLAQDHRVTCAAVGSTDYDAMPWFLPAKADLPALGVRSVAGAIAPGTRPDAGTVLDCGYPAEVLADFTRSLAGRLRESRPDVVWAQLEGAREILSAAAQERITGLLYVHDAEHDPRELRATADLGCHVVCSSGFLARKVEAIIGRPAHVVYPASDWYFGTAGDPAGFITMVNPFGVKGIDTLLEIARRMPLQRFLLQESWKLNGDALASLQQRLRGLPNVTFQHRVADMRDVYRATRLLLVPSVWEEGFGMVAVEAQSCGIPVIASARGGLGESVGQGGLLIHDHRNVDAWVSAIGRVLDDPAVYRHWSARARVHARSKAFDPRHVAARFLQICRTPAPRPSRLARGWRDLRRSVMSLPGMARVMPGAPR